MGETASAGAAVAEPPESGAPVVEFDKVSIGFDGKQVLEDVSFSVEHGQTLGVIGRNGSGKTTLLRVLAGVFQPDAGTDRKSVV